MDIASRSIQLGRRIRSVGRLTQIVNVFAKHGLLSLAERLGIHNWLTPQQVKEAEEISRSEGYDNGPQIPDVKGIPARLRRSFEELGPAFVKLGQLLAVREDLLPRDYIAELCKLHSNVSPLAFNVIEEIIKTELGADKLSEFESIDQKPLAAGSIAQVHRATLKDGTQVVVKVQRPNIDQLVKTDLALMEEFAALLERYIPETKVARPQLMIQEFKRALLSELDFIREAANIQKISKNFSNNTDIIIPEVFWPLSTERVLTLSELVGIPSWDRDKILAQGLEVTQLVEHGLHMFLKMVFLDGLYHGDLHPGNLLALPESKIGVLDFGLTVHVGRSTRENLAGLLLALTAEDYSRVVMHYAEIAEPDADFDYEAFERDLANIVAPMVGLSLEGMRTGKLFWEIARCAARNGAPMPQELVIFIKTLSSFEAIGTHLDPNFDVLKVTQDFSKEIAATLYSPDQIMNQGMRVLTDVGQLVKHAPWQIRRLLKTATAGQLRLQVDSRDLELLSLALDRSSSRVAISIVVAALIIGSSVLTFAGTRLSIKAIPFYGLVGFILAGVLALYIIWSILKGKRL